MDICYLFFFFYFWLLCLLLFQLRFALRFYFCTGCPKSSVRGGILIFLEKNPRGIRNKKGGKVEKFQVWVVWRFFLITGKTRQGGGVVSPFLVRWKSHAVFTTDVYFSFYCASNEINNLFYKRQLFVQNLPSSDLEVMYRRNMYIILEYSNNNYDNLEKKHFYL